MIYTVVISYVSYPSDTQQHNFEERLEFAGGGLLSAETNGPNT